MADDRRPGTRSAEDQETRRKRLIYRSQHRGTKELDLLIGTFALHNVPAMSSRQLDLFEALLEIPEPRLYAWLVGREQPAGDERNEVIDLLLNYQYSPTRF